MAGQEDDWEYASEDGEDYSWEYEDEEEEAAPEIAKDTAKKEEAKPEPKEEPKPAAKEEEAPKVERRSRAAVQAEREAEEKAEEEELAPKRVDKSERNAIMEQMKRLQEGYNDLEVDSDIDYSLTESESEDERPARTKPQKKVEEEEDLSDLDLLDPFGSEPVPVVQKKAVPQNGHGGRKEEGADGEGKKHRKHRKKSSRHESTFEKFRKLEKRDKTAEEDDGFSSKKIHVRSKDPSKIARQFEKSEKGRNGTRPGPKAGSKAPVKAPVIEVNKICKICGKEPYVVEKLVAEKSWWHKNCFRCKECNKTLNLDTYASHQGVIYCKPHHKDLFKPKAVATDLTEEICKKNIDFASYSVDGDIVERHKKQERRMETIVRENKPVQLEGVVKCAPDAGKWDGLDKLDVASKFNMFEKAAEERESDRRQASDRYGIMEKLKRLQDGEDVAELLAEIDDEMPSEQEDEEEDDPEEYGLTEVQKKAHRSEKLFDVDSKKEKLAMQRKVELKKLREKLMAGTRDSCLDSFDELNHRKIEKTKVEVRSKNAKKFMDMFNNGEVPEGMNAGDRTTLEKDAELAQMRKNKRGERDFFKKMENGELNEEKRKEPKLLIGKLKDNWIENDEEHSREIKSEVNIERMHAAKECKASSVLSKFKEMEKRVANGEDLEDDAPRNRPQPRRFTPPRKLGEESGSEYSDSEYSDSDYSYSDSEEYSDGYVNGQDPEENEYLRNVREAARAKQLRAKFEEWEAGLGEDGGYTNLVDENGLPLETASKLKNRFENMAIAEPTPPKNAPKKYQVKRFKPKEAYVYED